MGIESDIYIYIYIYVWMLYLMYKYAIVACGHKIVLSKNMSYGRTCFSGSYAFQDNMCYDSICVEGGHALL